MNIVFVDLDRCIACLSCMQVCIFRQRTVCQSEIPNILVQVDMDRRYIVTSTCRQCVHAFCMQACPEGALRRDPKTNAVVVDRSVCQGCALCVVSCPFGCVHLDELRRVVTKCDLCEGDPKCVQVCMAKALHYGSTEHLAELKRRRRDMRLVVRAFSDDSDGDESA